MATTTNYSWTTPDDTGLVKDGASAIRTLGTAIDTTTKNLNPSTTLGDIEYRSSTANTNTRLGIGSTGNVLTVSGGVPTWASPASGGSLTLLSTTSLSGSSTTISSISQSYYGLKFIVYGVNMSADNFFHCKVNGTAGLNYELYADGTMQMTANNGNDMYFAATATIKGGNTTNIWVVNIDNYASSSTRKPFDQHGTYTDSTNTIKSKISQGTIYTDTAISSLQFNANSGTFAGTVKLYGVN